jgi:hypothetical protein
MSALDRRVVGDALARIAFAAELLDVERWLASRRGTRERPGETRARGHGAATLTDDAIDRALARTPLADDMRTRLQRFLEGQPDAALERALTRASGNALQRAFELLSAPAGLDPT